MSEQTSSSTVPLIRWLGARMAFTVLALIATKYLVIMAPSMSGPFAADNFSAMVGTVFAIVAALLYRPFLSWLDQKPANELVLDRAALSQCGIGMAISLATLFMPVVVLIVEGKVPAMYITAPALAGVTAHALYAEVIEEILFRGFLLLFLLRFCNPIIACVLVSVAFMVAHLHTHSSLGLLSVLLSGAAMTISYFFQRSLWMPIGMHFAWDWPVFALEHFPAVMPNAPRGTFTSLASLSALYGAEGIVIVAMVSLLAWRAMASKNDQTAM